MHATVRALLKSVECRELHINNQESVNTCNKWRQNHLMVMVCMCVCQGVCDVCVSVCVRERARGTAQQKPKYILKNFLEKKLCRLFCS